MDFTICVFLPNTKVKIEHISQRRLQDAFKKFTHQDMIILASIIDASYATERDNMEVRTMNFFMHPNKHDIDGSLLPDLMACSSSDPLFTFLCYLRNLIANIRNKQNQEQNQQLRDLFKPDANGVKLTSLSDQTLKIHIPESQIDAWIQQHQ